MQLQAKKKQEQVYNKALNLLSYRPRSERELRMRLLQFAHKKGLADHQAVVERVVSVLCAEGKVDDLEFAKWWIEQRINFKPRGKRLLNQELRKKGVAEKAINQAIEFFWQEERDKLGVKREAVSEKSLAEKAARRKLASLGKLAGSEFKQKMVRYLLRRGFEYEVCSEVIEKLIEESNT